MGDEQWTRALELRASHTHRRTFYHRIHERGDGVVDIESEERRDRSGNLKVESIEEAKSAAFGAASSSDYYLVEVAHHFPFSIDHKGNLIAHCFAFDGREAHGLVARVQYDSTSLHAAQQGIDYLHRIL